MSAIKIDLSSIPCGERTSLDTIFRARLKEIIDK